MVGSSILSGRANFPPTSRTGRRMISARPQFLGNSIPCFGMRAIPFALAVIVLFIADKFGNDGAATDTVVALLNQGLRFALHVLHVG